MLDPHSLLPRLVPDAIVSAEVREDVDVELYAEEERSLGQAVEKRRLEFTSGRACARRAMRKLGVGPAPIPSGERGEPIWPDGIVGSITHCARFRGAVVARAAEIASVGIDAEANAPLPDGVFEDVAFGTERRLRGEMQGVWLDRLLFSAKEAIYKAWFPCAKRWLGFEDVELLVDLAEGTFRAPLLVVGPLVDGEQMSELRGRWCVEDGLICTAVVVPRLAKAPVASAGAGR